jgi:hypothetical protein
MALKRSSIVLALLFASRHPAAAQTRPFLTEEATTAPEGTLALESGFDWISRQPNFLTGAERARWDGPILRLVYSPADRVEMDLEWVAGIGVTSDPDFGTRSGFGDVSLRAKLRFVDDDDRHPAMGARFAVTLPNTGYGDGLAPNTLRTRAEFLVSKRAGPVRVHVNLGFAVEDAPLEPHEQADFFAWGAAMDYEFLSGVALTAEGNGVVGNPLPGVGGRGEARMGLRFGSGRFRADAAVRRGFVPEAGEWGYSAGMRYEINGKR